jgi:hypothetical protein
MPFRRQQIAYLVIPGNAGPGEARIVITSVLPPPLDTYTWGLPVLRYAGGIIWYPTGDEDTYLYLCVVEDVTDNNVAVHMGSVLNGVVEESPLGVPLAQVWQLFSATGERFDFFNTELFSVLAQDDISIITQGIAAVLGLQSAGTITVAADGSITITSSNGPVAITGEEINLFPTNELQMQGTRAYVLTQIQTNRATPSLALTNAQQNVGNTLITLPTVTANARYKVQTFFDMNHGATAETSIGRLIVDGVTQASEALHRGSGDRDTVGQTYSGTLATADNHTFQLAALASATTGVITAEALHTGLTVEIWESGG